MRSLGELAEVRVIEWYDGIVSGLVRFSVHSHWSYVSLLGWSPHLQEKLYALVPLDVATAKRILPLVAITSGSSGAEDWFAIQKEVELLKRAYRGSVYLIRCRNLEEPALAMMEVGIDDHGIRHHLGREVDVAVAEGEMERWLELLPGR
jgi:hypothetical protein